MIVKLMKILMVIILTSQAPNASAGLIYLEATIDGSQANAGAGSGSTATGLALLILNTDTNQLDWNVSWSDLLGNITAAHFHGAALANQNAAVVLNFYSLAPANPSIGNAIITGAQANDLLAGLWYVNIHTDDYPAGEIRGQIRPNRIPEPTTIALLLIAASALFFKRLKQS